MTETIYYSATDGCFLFACDRPAYDQAGTWPTDAIEVTPEEWQQFGESPPPQGARRGADASGRPAWVTLVLTPEQLIVQARAWRDAQLRATDIGVIRHRDQLEAGVTATLTGEQYKQLQGFRTGLRQWPDSPGFPDASQRPQVPSWLGVDE